jgi:flagellar protein FlgJ
MESAMNAAWAVSAFDWGSPRLLTGKSANDPEVRKLLGQQFEALLMGQMLRSMREAGGDGWMGEGGDAAGLGLMELAEQQLALAMASSGGLGLAELIERAFPRDPAPGPESKATPGAGSGRDPEGR